MTTKPKALENLKRSWKKVMEYEELKRVRTLVNGTKRFPDSIKKKKKRRLKKRQNGVMSYIIQRMLRKGRYCISIVLTFSCGRAKTIGIRVFFRKRKKKYLRFQKHQDTCKDDLDEDYYIFCNFIFVFEFT